MSHKRSPLCVSALVALAAVVVLFPASHAQPPTGSSHYVTVSFAGHTVNGGFEGSRTLSTVKGFFSIPAVEAGSGIATAIGTRTGWVGLEANYWQSSHNGRFGATSGRASKHALGIDGRFYVPDWGVVTPFISGGVFWEWLSADNGYCSDLTGDRCTERFKGFGVSFGPGVNVHVMRSIFVVGRLVYRHTDYDAISSTSADEGTLAYTIDGNGWTWSTGVGFEF